MVLPIRLSYIFRSLLPVVCWVSISNAWQEIVQSVLSMGRSWNFTGNEYFSIRVDSAASKIEGRDYEYKPKNGS